MAEADLEGTQGACAPLSPPTSCAFHFVEIFRLVEIASLLHVIVMLEEKIIEND